ncbi:hypothetical protein ABUW04_02745 [Streptacidiphilus sp. N1-10]|uniref:Uncharacterized protein n=1 Tax=Streptacidiphilus jeojiensis TaxID=3229225 RepID=A0ABV6XFY2_9ACTN
MRKLTVARPVVDPSLDPRERELLEQARPEELAPASGPPPGPPRWGGRNGADVLAMLPLAILGGFLPVLVHPFTLGRARGLLLGGIAQLLLVAGALWFGVNGFMSALLVLQVLTWAALLVFGCGESEAARVGRECHGRYRTAEDFGPPELTRLIGVSPLSLMTRARVAVARVLESEVNRDGMLDEVANAVSLPAQEWDTARALGELARLGREVEDAAEDGADSPRFLEVLQVRKEALRVSGEALERRVEALERYAESTRAADAAYQEWQAVRELEELDEGMRDLVARSVQDDLAVAEIEALTGGSSLAELRRSLGDALKAGQEVRSA